MTTQTSAQMCFKMAAKQRDLLLEALCLHPLFIFSLCYSPEKRRHVCFHVLPQVCSSVTSCWPMQSVFLCVSTVTHTEPSVRIHAADRIRSVAMAASGSSLGVKALPVAFRGLLSFLSLLLSSLLFAVLVHSASSLSLTLDVHLLNYIFKMSTYTPPPQKKNKKQANNQIKNTDGVLRYFLCIAKLPPFKRKSHKFSPHFTFFHLFLYMTPALADYWAVYLQPSHY